MTMTEPTATSGEKVLKDKKDRRIISFHESLGYFAKEFDITIVDVIEEGPGQEPGPEAGTGAVSSAA